MTYENMADSGLDYYPCRYGSSKLLFRGPRKKMQGSYVAMIGGTETYGKFIETPFPALVENATGLECVNFGCMNAGLDVFANEPTVLEACSKAKVTVVQVMGAQNMSNRFYAVHPRRNDRFLRASTLLKTVFREVDFTDFHFTKHLLSTIQVLSDERFGLVRDELKEAWVSRMDILLNKIEGKKVLLWFSGHVPDEDLAGGDLSNDPLFVDRAMIERIRPHVSDVVEVIPSAKAMSEGTDGMLFSPMDEPAAGEMLGLGAHAEAAKELIPSIMRYV